MALPEQEEFERRVARIESGLAGLRGDLAKLRWMAGVAIVLVSAIMLKLFSQ